MSRPRIVRIVRGVACCALLVAFVCLSSSIVSVGAWQEASQGGSGTATTGGTQVQPAPVERKKCNPAVAVTTNGETCNRGCVAAACPAVAGACVVFTSGGCVEGTGGCNPISATVTNFLSTCETLACAVATEFRCNFQASTVPCGNQTYSSCIP